MMTPAQALLHQATGLNLSRAAAERALQQRMEQTGAADQDSYLAQITPAELTALVELVVVPESWFYRDPLAFSAALDFVRARLAADATRQVRILSLPCAGGEEPYTMAMTLADAGIPPASVAIDAYDISPECVARAQAGVYGRNAFRSQDLGFRERHFTQVGEDAYRINDAIRQQVRIRQGNLLAFDSAISYDVIFCRNLLIYFDRPTTKAAIARLDALLAPDGQLYVGYAEVSSLCQHGYTPLPYAQAFGLKKKTAGPRRPAPASAAAPGPARPAHPVAPRAARRVASPPSLAPAPVRTPAPRPAAPAPQPAPAADLLAEARRLADLGQLQDAERCCREDLAQHPESAQAYFILGLLNEMSDKPQLAEDYWKRCIYLQPDHYEALCHLALLAEAHNDKAGAARLKARAARVYKRQQA